MKQTELKGRLSRYRPTKLSVIAGKSGRAISVPFRFLSPMTASIWGGYWQGLPLHRMIGGGQHDVRAVQPGGDHQGLGGRAVGFLALQQTLEGDPERVPKPDQHLCLGAALQLMKDASPGRFRMTGYSFLESAPAVAGQGCS